MNSLFEWQKATKGRISMEATSFLGERRGSIVIGYNQDSIVEDDEVLLMIEHILVTCEIGISDWPRKPRHGWKISTIVGFIHENQRQKTNSVTAQ